MIPLNIETRIFEILMDCGAKTNLKGYDYLKSAIYIAIEDKNRDVKMMGMYSDVGKEFNTTPSRVERAIRHCIENMLLEPNYKATSDSVKNVLNRLINPESGRVSNSTFIYAIAEIIRMDIKNGRV